MVSHFNCEWQQVKGWGKMMMPIDDDDDDDFHMINSLWHE